MTVTCTHTDSIQVTQLPELVVGCEDCLKFGGRWLHLRMCLTCGKIACCDNSPNRHASEHFRLSGHPLIRSAEPEEEWAWCYVDEVPLTLAE